MTAVRELIPGFRVKNGSMSAVFIGTLPHPIYPGLKMVIWVMDESGEVSLDALSARQDVGMVDPADSAERRYNLQKALLGR